ncbi:MAG: tripartite tricarboxylate transporter TctB family protein [Pseudomonadota bacterium]|nr:tripartite tricarboxylate transporter TctB family protein [Pseudomonadota bacterium]
MAASTKAGRIAPYAAMLAASAYLYYDALHFDYLRVAGRIGPDAWPRMVLVLLMLLCAWQVLRLALGRDTKGVQGIAQTLEAAVGAPVEEESPHRAAPVWFGIALTFAYLLLFEIIGFFAASFFYLVALMFVGGYRRLLRASALSLAVCVGFVLIFMKFVYVSLPLGRGPFLTLSVAVMRLLGIH